MRVDLTVQPGRWVDLDSLLDVVIAGLRDGGAVAPRLANLHALLASKREGVEEGVSIESLGVDAVRAAAAPGDAQMVIDADVAPRPGDRAGKRRLRALIAEQAPASMLDGSVWADVALRVPGSLLGPLEPTLDALEPVLGRDPRGRAWQEFFPNDHRIDWLRVVRSDRGPLLRLRLGTSQSP